MADYAHHTKFKMLSPPLGCLWRSKFDKMFHFNDPFTTVFKSIFFLNLLLPSQMTWTLSIQLISECYSQIQIIVHCCRSHNRRSRLVYSAWPCSISNGLASRDAKWTWIPWDRVLLNVNWVKKFSTSVLKIRLGRYLLKVITEFFIFCE